MNIYFDTQDQLVNAIRLVQAGWDLAEGETITAADATQQARAELDANEVATWPLDIVDYTQRHAYFDVLTATDLEIKAALALIAEQDA